MRPEWFLRDKFRHFVPGFALLSAAGKKRAGGGRHVPRRMASKIQAIGVAEFAVIRASANRPSVPTTPHRIHSRSKCLEEFWPNKRCPNKRLRIATRYGKLTPPGGTEAGAGGEQPLRRRRFLKRRKGGARGAPAGFLRRCAEGGQAVALLPCHRIRGTPAPNKARSKQGLQLTVVASKSRRRPNPRWAGTSCARSRANNKKGGSHVT